MSNLEFGIFLSTISSKFAVECYWNSKISQIHTKFVFFFEKKNDFLLKISKGGKFAVECVSNDSTSQECLFHIDCEDFFEKIRNFQLEKKRFHPFKGTSN